MIVISAKKTSRVNLIVFFILRMKFAEKLNDIGLDFVKKNKTYFNR